MSADDFQNKYASVMESMLKAAIAETTKLFENMVDELKTEISQIKKENEDLKSKCSQFQIVQSHPVEQSNEETVDPERSEGSGKCDSGVQCDIPYRTVLVEQCQPLVESAQQNQDQQNQEQQEQQGTHDFMGYTWQEHNYVSNGDGDSKMAFVLVKQEESNHDSFLQSSMKQEDEESDVVSGQVLTKTVGTSVAVVEHEGPMINQESSTAQILSPQQTDSTQMILQLPSIGMDNNSQLAQTQLPVLNHSLVISLKDALREDFKEENEVCQMTTEMDTSEELTSAQKLVPEECCLDKTLLHEQTEVTGIQSENGPSCTNNQLAESALIRKEAACEELKANKPDVDTNPKPDPPPRRKRGRPPKKRRQKRISTSAAEVPREKGIQAAVNTSTSKSSETCATGVLESSSIVSPPVKESANTSVKEKKTKAGSSTLSAEYLSTTVVSPEKQPLLESSQLNIEVEKKENQVKLFREISANKTQNPPQSESPQAPLRQLKERKTSVSLQDAMLLIEAMNQSTMENTIPLTQITAQPQTHSTHLADPSESPATQQTPFLETQPTAEILDNVSSNMTATGLSNDTMLRNTEIPKRTQSSPTYLRNTTLVSSVSSASPIDTVVQSLPLPLVNVGPPAQVPRTIIILPRPHLSYISHNTVEVSESQPSTVDSATSQKIHSSPLSQGMELFCEKSSHSSSPKAIKVTYRKLDPVSTLQATSILTDHQYVIPPCKKITVVPKMIRQATGPVFLKVKQSIGEQKSPVDTPEPEALVHTPEPETLVDTPEPEALATTPEPEATVHTPESEAPVDIPEAKAPVDTPEPEVPLDTPEPEAPLDTPVPEATVHTPELEVPVHTLKLEALVHTLEPEAPVHTPEPEAPVDTPEPEVPLDTPVPEATVHTPELEVPVHTLKMEALVHTLEPEAPVDIPEAKAPVDTPEPEAPLDTPEPEAPLDTPEPEVPLDTPEPEAPLDTPELEAPINTPEPEVPVDAPEPEVPVEAPEPEVPVEAPEPEVPVDAPEPEAPVDAPEPEAPVDIPEPEAPVDIPEPKAPVDTPEPKAPVDTPEPKAPVDTPEPEAPVDTPEPEAPVDTPEPEAPVDTLEPEAPVDTLEPEAPVDTPEPEAPVDTPEPEAPVDTPEPEAPVDTPEPEAPVETPEPETPVETLDPEAPVKTLDPEAPVKTLEPEAPVDTLEPEAPVDTLEPEPPVDTPEPKASVDTPELKASVSLSSTQLKAFSQEPSLVGAKKTLSEKSNMTDDPNSSSQTTADLKTIDTCTNISTNIEMSVKEVQTLVSSVLPPTTEQKLYAVVKLTRLPFPVSTKQSFSVSTLQAKIISSIPEKQLKPSISLSVSSDVKVVPGSQPVLGKSTVASNLTEVSSEPITFKQPTADMYQDMISCEREMDHKEDLGLPASIRFSDQSDPRLKMTQSEFLEQLSVSALHKESCTNKGLDAIKTRTSAHQKSSIVSRLRSHLKPLLKARRNAREQVPNKQTENSDKTPKKPRWDSDSLNVKNTTEEPAGSGKPDVSDNITSLNTHTSSSRISEHCKDVTPTKIVSGKVFVSLSRLDITSNFAAKSFKSQSTNTGDVDLVKSELMNPRQSTSARNSMSPKTSKLASESQRSTFEKDDASPRNKGSSTVSHGSPSCTKSSESSKNTGNGSAPKNTKSSSLSPIRSTKAVASPEKTGEKEIGTSPEVSGFPSSSTSIKVSPSAKPIKRESSSFSPGRCSISKDNNSEKNMSETSSPLAKIFKIAKNTTSVIRTQKLTPDKLQHFQESQSIKLNRSGRIIKPRKPRGKYKKRIRIRNEIGKVLQICKAKIWYPPTLPPNEVPSTEIIKAPRLKVEYRVPVIPLNPTPIVSPLQPLAFIGRHLLRNQCGECGRVFNSTSALESHVSLHKFLRPFTCKLCGKYFPDAITFKRHDRVHRNGRIYVCPQCGKGFVYRFALSKHVQMVHGKVKPFICQLCNKRFFTKRDVDIHIRIHTGEKPFQCHICERRFTRKVELNVHLRWHNGEKRHWCPHCGKGFLDSNNLKRHLITHTGEKPFACSLCPKRYTQTGHLTKHIRNVHSVVKTQDIQQNAVLN